MINFKELQEKFDNEVYLKQLSEDGVEFHLVYLIDSHTRKHVIGDDSVAGFVFLKTDEGYKSFWACQMIPGGSRSEFEGLAIFLKEEAYFDESLKIIKDENNFESIFMQENINDSKAVAALIEDIESSFAAA